MFAIAWFTNNSSVFTPSKSSVEASFKLALNHRDEELKKVLETALLDSSTVNYQNLALAYKLKFNKLYENQQIGVFVFDNDSLVYWTTNTIPVDNNLFYSGFRNRVVELKNGWYQSAYIQKDNVTYWALGLVKYNLPYENNYLENTFQASFTIPENLQIKIAPPIDTKLDSPTDVYENYVLVYPDTLMPQEWVKNLTILLCCLGLFFVFWFVDRLYSSLHKTTLGIFWGLCIISLLVGARYIMFSKKFPNLFYDTKLFSPGLYAESEYLPSLGDLLLNTLLASFIIYLFNRYIHINKNRERLSQLVRYSLGIGLFLLVLFIAPVVFNLLKGLVLNSNISFNINNLFALNPYSYIAFIIFGILIFTTFLLADKLLSCAVYHINNNKTVWLLYSVAAIATFLVSPEFTVDNIVYHLFITLIGVLIIINKLSTKQSYGFTLSLSIILSSAVFSTYIISYNAVQKEHLNRVVMGSKLAQDNDPILEFLFTEVEAKINTDSILHSYLVPGIDEGSTSKDLNELYFNGYWDKYEIKASFFGNDNCQLRVVSTSEKHDAQFFEQQIREIGVPTYSPNFYLTDLGNGRVSYLAKIKLAKYYKGYTYQGTLYVEFASKYNIGEIGYPTLLLDRKLSNFVDWSDYSYARYTEGRLISHFGKFPYSLNDYEFRNATQANPWIEKDNYEHYVLRSSGSTLVVLSRPNYSFIELITPFSYFFFFFSILSISYYIFWRYVKAVKDTGIGFSLSSRVNFKTRIQFTLVSLLLVSLFVIAGGTIAYVIGQNRYKNNELISEKVKSVSAELGNTIGDSPISPYMFEDLSYKLSRMANVFFVDINMYDTSGRLIASSRPVIFEQGLISKNMQPEALNKLRLEQSTEYIHDEQVGKLSYMSAYVPFRNNSNVLLGYINLPYFSKQEELRKEISTVLIAIVNIYALLIGVSVILALLISNRITRPLIVIQEKMGRLRLGKTNEYIDYRANDEIGKLVAEYNRMINELEKSARLLAQSERESAWKEMAKQVAHEIKNPLTPMKLSVQQLQRTYEPNNPNWEDKFKRFTEGLIEQIDTLSKIASEFADFARMPKSTMATVNLVGLLKGLEILNTNQANTHIYLEIETTDIANVVADKDQLLRVFNNLIKNAQQAIPETVEGKITIKLYMQDTSYIVKVTDNGVGISADIQPKIFVPNFTTKNSGMGLGLAIVKSIVEECKGKIWFETKEGKGTSFFVELQAV